MKILAIIIPILFIVYNVIVIKITCIPTSLSETFYNLKEKYKCGWIFTVFLFVISITSMLLLLYITKDKPYQFLSFLSAIGLIFVAVSPNFKNLENRKIHFIFATLSLVCALILIFCLKFYFLIICNIVLALYLILSKNKFKIYYIEVSVFTSIFITIIFKMFNCI